MADDDPPGKSAQLLERWPRGLTRAPNLRFADRLVALIKQFNMGVTDPDEVARSLGISVSVAKTTVSEGCARGTLLTDFGHIFSIIIDPDPSAEGEPALDYMAFRKAHEIGHTVFYDWSEDPPRHLTVSGPEVIISRDEEVFCDGFGLKLLGLDPSKREPSPSVWDTHSFVYLRSDLGS